MRVSGPSPTSAEAAILPLSVDSELPRRFALARAGALIGPAMTLANLLQYVLQVAASRFLAPAGFGGFGALVGLGVIGAVPMLALQTVGARHVALRRDDPAARAGEASRLIAASLRVAAALSLAGLLAAPLVAAFLHVPVLAAALLALSLGPLAVAGTAQGVLQGRERFGALAVVYLVISALRVLGGVVGLAVSPTITAGIGGLAAGTLLAAVLAVVALRHERAPRPYGAEPVGFRRELRQAMTGVLALLTLGGADLLLARHLLPGTASGRYAAGGLVARGCFWAPQFVAVLIVPRVTSGERRVLHRALAIVAALGLVEIAVGFLAPPALITLVFGAGYTSLHRTLALFALAGALLAVLQLLLQSGIARGGSTVGRWTWGALGAEVLLALTVRPGPVGLVTLAACAIAAATAGSLLSVLRQSPP